MQLNMTTCRFYLTTSLNFSMNSVNIFNSVSKEKFKNSASKLYDLPEMRKSIIKVTGGVPYAAVLVPLLANAKDGKPGVLFTLRSSKLESHRSEVSFPGGAIDGKHETPSQAALREAREEINLSPECVELWSELPPILSRDLKRTIIPVVGVIHKDFKLLSLQPNAHEVEEIFVRYFDDLCAPKNVAYTQWRLGFYKLPVFLGSPYRIWGISALILHMTFSILIPDLYMPHVKFGVKD